MNLLVLKFTLENESLILLLKSVAVWYVPSTYSTSALFQFLFIEEINNNLKTIDPFSFLCLSTTLFWLSWHNHNLGYIARYILATYFIVYNQSISYSLDIKSIWLNLLYPVKIIKDSEFVLLKVNKSQNIFFCLQFL